MSTVSDMSIACSSRIAPWSFGRLRRLAFTSLAMNCARYGESACVELSCATERSAAASTCASTGSTPPEVVEGTPLRTAPVTRSSHACSSCVSACRASGVTSTSPASSDPCGRLRESRSAAALSSPNVGFCGMVGCTPLMASQCVVNDGSTGTGGSGSEIMSDRLISGSSR